MTNQEKVIKYIEKHGYIDASLAESELDISSGVFSITIEEIRKKGIYLLSKSKKNKTGQYYREYRLYEKPKKIIFSEIKNNQQYVKERNKLIYAAEKQAREHMKKNKLSEEHFHAVFHDKMDRLVFEVMGVKQSWMI